MTIVASADPSKPGRLGSWLDDGLEARATYGQYWRAVLAFSLVTILFQLGAHVFHYTDYIGPDPDDSMRLVEVRDYLAGQGWFDLRQYRLGPDGGTLMHWSRLIDLPIALLISAFSLFLAPEAAEAAAVAVWPLLLVLPLMAATGLAGHRLGGRSAMLVALALAALFLTAIIRFRPGAVDHHNVQLVLAITIAAMLVDPLARASSFALAALAGAFALAIGVETTPLVAVTAIVVAVLWAVYGERYRRAALAFGLAFGLGTAAIFFATTPASLYGAVTCDALSVGMFALAAAGGLGLALSAALMSLARPALRLASLAGVGALVLVVALVVAPQCLHNPLNDLDPLLKTMWLGNVTEAQSLLAELATDPGTIGGFYAVGLIALATSAFRILHGDRPVPHAILAVLIGVSWAVSAFQVRGMIFSNFLAFVPLAALIAEARSLYLARRNDTRAALAFVFAALASLPSAWTFAGVLAVQAGDAIAGVPAKPEEDETSSKSCMTEAGLRPLAALPKGRVLSTSNPGSALLRFTPHSVLTANYHRNQAGMVAALKIAMAGPDEALVLLKAQNIDYIVFCPDDPTVGTMVHDHKDGLFARLVAGERPDYLEDLTTGDPKLQRLYRLK